RMADLQLAADKEAGQMRLAQGRMTAQQILDMDLSFNAKEYDAKRQALQNELSAIEGSGTAVENEKRKINNKLLELDRQFQNQDQQLLDQAQKKEQATLQSSMSRMDSTYASGFAKVIMGKESMGKMMQQIDSQ